MEPLCGCTEISYCSMHLAAPELLEACKQALAALRELHRIGDLGIDAASSCLAAITKAEGREA